MLAELLMGGAVGIAVHVFGEAYHIPFLGQFFMACVLGAVIGTVGALNKKKPEEVINKEENKE